MICLKLNKKTQLCLAAAFFYLKREIPLLELMLTVDIHLRKAKVALDLILTSRTVHLWGCGEHYSLDVLGKGYHCHHHHCEHY